MELSINEALVLVWGIILATVAGLLVTAYALWKMGNDE